MVMWHIYEYAVPVIILAVLFGLRWKAGMWGNCLSLGAVLFSALIAVGWWEDLAQLLAKQVHAMLFLADGIAFWTIFIFALAILDAATRFLSTVKVKYADTVENIGNGAVLFLLFLAIYGTFLFAEELGPVGENDGISLSDSTVAIQMLRILSAGNLSVFTQTNQFDSSGNFRKLHLQRRQAIMYNAKTKEGVLARIQSDEGNFDKMDRKRDRNSPKTKEVVSDPIQADEGNIDNMHQTEK